jgi:LPXTG-site transpeptidase (sortase) family protein
MKIDSGNTPRAIKTLSIILTLSVVTASGFFIRPPKNVVASPLQVPSEKPLGAPTTTITTTLPSEGLIGECVDFTVTFDNNGTIGYGPFIDLVIPVTGADGANIEVDDGLTISVNDITYAGQPLNPAPLPATFQVSPTYINHPYAVTTGGTPVQVNPPGSTIPGDGFISFLLPFGSYVYDQPPTNISITTCISSLADLNIPLTLYARGGYQYGEDPLNNPATDPSIVGSWMTSQIYPTLLTLEKTYIGPEDETATGPNYQRQYIVSADIANGQTLTDFYLEDDLPNNLQYVVFNTATPGGWSIIPPYGDQPVTGSAQNPPNNDLIANWATVTGTTGAVDASMTFSYFVPWLDADASLVLPEASCTNDTSIDDAKATYTWTPIDTRDSVVTGAMSDLTPTDHTLTDKSMAIQKSVGIAVDNNATDFSPLDILEYTLEIQISDFFGYENLFATDTISDGQHYYTDGTHQPTMTVYGNPGWSLSGNMNALNVEVLPNYTPVDPAPNDGTTDIIFHISDELLTRNRPNGWLVGGCIPVDPGGTSGGTGVNPIDCSSYNDLATTVEIHFFTQIQENFTDDFPSLDPSVDQGDQFLNDVILTGDRLNRSDLTATTLTCTNEDSHASAEIGYGVSSKTIYAINGNAPSAAPVQVAAGDEVTYRVRYTLPTSDEEDLTITDYLPLPVYDATEMLAGNFIASVSSGPTDVPGAGWAMFGPDDTFYAYSSIVPVITVDAAGNWIEFFYGDYNNPAHNPTVVDLLFTFTIQTDPFADKLFLTNQASIHEGSTNNEDQDVDTIVQIQLTEPVLAMNKSVVYTNGLGTVTPALGLSGVTFNAGGCPRFSGAISSTKLGSNHANINSNLTGADAGDMVTFAIVVENTGTGLNGAFDVRLRDALPANYTYAGNLCATDGTGAVINTTDLSGGLTGTGIELVDPGPTATPAGALDYYDADNGRNLAIITYDATLNTTVIPRTIYTNTATLFNYSGSENGDDFTNPTDLTETATVTTRDPVAAKTIIQTEINNTNNNNLQAVIGELIDYRLTITIPEGTLPATRIVDTLAGSSNAAGNVQLVFVKCLGVSASSGLSTDLSGGFVCDSLTGNPAITNNGRTLTFTLGNILNSNIDNATPETITLEYQVVVNNISGNQQGNQRRNSAVFSWDTPAKSLATANAPYIRVLEPQLDVQKDAYINSVLGGTGMAGDPVSYTIVLRHPSPTVNYDTDAFDVTFSDPLPVAAGGDSLILNTSNTANPPALTVVDSAGLVTITDFDWTGSTATGWTLQTVTGTSFDFPYSTSRTITLTVTGVLSPSAPVGTAVTNTAAVLWTSLDGDYSTARSSYNTNSTERTGTLTPVYNDYRDTDPGSFNVTTIDAVKSIIDTNQTFTSGLNVAVGEQVRYQVSYTIPQGTMYQATSTDVLDSTNSGLAIVGCNSVTASSGLSSTIPSAFDCANMVVSNNGRQASFNFGTLTNSDTNPALPETIVIDYWAVILNTSGVNAGSLHHNTATASWATTPSGPVTVSQTGSAPDVIVYEPDLSVDKSFNTISGDAADLITMTVVIRHDHTTYDIDAYNLHWEDAIPTGFTYNTGSFSQSSGPVLTWDESTPTLLQADLAAFLLTDTDITFQFTLTIDNNIAPGTTLTNTAQQDWSSLPAVVSQQSTFNTNSCERTGDATAACGLSNNDYTTSDPATLDVPWPVHHKTLFTTSAGHTSDPDVTIGEVITYDISVTMVEGLTSSLTLRDNLPVGLDYVTGSAQLLSAGFGGIFSDLSDPAVDASAACGDGHDICFSFDPITVTGDNVTTNNAFTIRFQALVLDLSSNSGLPPQTNLVNNATMIVDGHTINPQEDVTTPVVEPRLVITKTITPDTAAIGDTVTISLVVENTGTSTAYDVIIDDPLITDPPNNKFTNILEGTTPSGFTYSTVYAAPNMIVRYTGGSIATGAANALTFTFTTDVINIIQGEVVHNVATVTQDTTLPGVDPDERDEPDVTGEDTINGVAPDMAVTKDDSQTVVVPGQVLIYSIQVTNTGDHEATGVVVTETIPTNTVFVPGSSSTGWDCTAAPTCTYNIAGSVGVNATVTVLFAVQIDTPLSPTVTQIVNHVAVADDGVYGVDPTPDDNTDDDIDTINAAPDINAIKSAQLIDSNSNGQANPGETLRYTIVITNSGDQNATNVMFTDTPDVNTTLVVGSVTTTQGTVIIGNSSGDINVSVGLGTINGNTAGVDGTATIIFDVTINDPLPVGIDQVVNQGIMTGDNFPDEDTNEVVTPVVASPILHIDKDDGGATALPGGIIIYTLSYWNDGDQDANGTVLTDVVPNNTVFDSANSSSGWSCADGDLPGTSCTYTVGVLPADAIHHTLNFAVRVDTAPLPVGVELIENTAVIADDSTPPVTDEDDDDTPVDADPVLHIIKSDADTSVAPGGLVIYTIEFWNDGNQDANNVEISDAVPAYTIFNSANSTPGWSCTDGSTAGTTCLYTVGILPANGIHQTITFAVRLDLTVIPAGLEAIHNITIIYDDSVPPVTDQDDEDTPIDGYPDLSVVKDDGLTIVATGSIMTYTLTIANSGTQDADGVDLIDHIPDHTTFLSASLGGTYDNPSRSVTWPVFSLAAGSNTTRTVTVQVDNPLDSQVTSFLNQVQVIDPTEEDPTIDDNTDEDEDMVAYGVKTMEGTNHDFTTGNDVAIGEIVTYEVRLSIPPGPVNKLLLTDTLDRGLAFVDCVSITATLAGSLVSSAGSLDQICASGLQISDYISTPANPADAGRIMQIDFGTLTNLNQYSQALIVRYRAVVLDTLENIRGVSLQNHVNWSWGDGNSLPLAPPPAVVIVEPELAIEKSVNPTTTFPGNDVTFTLVISNTTASNTNAYDVIITDTLPIELSYVPATLQVVSGKTPDLMQFSGNTLTVAFSEFLPTDQSTISFNAFLASNVNYGNITNTAYLNWTSLPLDYSDPQTDANPRSFERFYNPGDGIDTYGRNDDAVIRIPRQLPWTGFAPGVVTSLTAQPANLEYEELGDLWIEIPVLGLRLPITGVPFVDGNWDLTWLGKQAGYLEGTAFPTMNGNSGITAHVYNADGTPGPFVNLGTLKWGDEIIIHSQGTTYHYEVREVNIVYPDQIASLRHENQSWVTLITCKGYNSKTGEYKQRIEVRAVLVETGI